MALEATCDALITLQTIDALPSTGAAGHGERHVAQAISHLREAIDELRDAQTEGQTGLAMGFVLAGDRRASGAEGQTGHSSAEGQGGQPSANGKSSADGAGAQSSPRRTA
jgi:hypothetical protein